MKNLAERELMELIPDLYLGMTFEQANGVILKFVRKILSENVGLRDDKSKLRNKVEQNIPVERISGLDDKLKNSIQVGTDGELYVEGKKISNIGTFIKEPTVSIEDHEALKKDFTIMKDGVPSLEAFNQLRELVKFNHNDTHKYFCNRFEKLEDKVAELSKRPVSSEFVNLGQINGNSSWARIEDLKPGPGPQA